MQGFFVGGILQCRRDSLRKARRAQAQAGTEYKKAPRKCGFFITFCAGADHSEKRGERKPKPEPNIRKPHGSGGFLLHSVQARAAVPPGYYRPSLVTPECKAAHCRPPAGFGNLSGFTFRILLLNHLPKHSPQFHTITI